MARTPEPSALHEIKGSYDKNPQRRRKGEPKPKAGIGPAPAHLDEYEREAWDELVGMAMPGVLGDSDRWIAERCVRLMAESRRDPDNFSGAKNGHLIACLSRLGMTPADRTRLSVPDQGKKDEWEDF